MSVLDIRTGDVLATVDTGLPEISSAAVFPDMKRLLVGCAHTWVHVYDLQTQTETGAVARGPAEL